MRKKTYRPYGRWEDWMLNKVVRHKSHKGIRIISGVFDRFYQIALRASTNYIYSTTLNDLFENYENPDGTPFGEEVTEVRENDVCEYCDDECKNLDDENNDIIAYISEGELRLYSEEYELNKDIKIKYCPNCGREL